MTIIAAVRKHNDVWMMADSQTSWSDLARSDADRSKIIKLDNALIGVTGRALFNNALEFFLDLNPELFAAKFDGALDVSRFFSMFYKFLKDEFGLGGAQSNDVAVINYSGFLVATPDKIFVVGSDRSVSVFDNYAAVGSGSDITLGVMHALNDLLSDPAEILQRAFDTCCHFMTSCGGEMRLMNVRDYLTRNTLVTIPRPIEPVPCARAQKPGVPIGEEELLALQLEELLPATGHNMENFLHRIPPRKKQGKRQQVRA